MKDCFYQYRKGLYEALNGNVAYDGSNVPVMEFAGKEQAKPFIQILGMTAIPETDHSNPSQMVTTRIQVVTGHVGEIDDFGSKQADDIMNDVMELLISQGVSAVDRAKHITMTDFTDNGCWLDNLTYEPIYDGSEFMIIKVLTIETMIDEV